MDLSYSTPPMPKFDLTIEQEFKLRRMQDLLDKCPKEEIIPLFLSLQKTNFILTNNIGELLKVWNTPLTTPEEPSKPGTTLETKN